MKAARGGQALRKPRGVGLRRYGPVIRPEGGKARESDHRLIRLGPPPSLEMHVGNGPLPVIGSVCHRFSFLQSGQQMYCFIHGNTKMFFALHERLDVTLLV